jgi:hypothetical protein
MKFRNANVYFHVLKMAREFLWKFLAALPEIDIPLTHDIVTSFRERDTAVLCGGKEGKVGVYISFSFL